MITASIAETLLLVLAVNIINFGVFVPTLEYRHAYAILQAHFEEVANANKSNPSAQESAHEPGVKPGGGDPEKKTASSSHTDEPPDHQQEIPAKLEGTYAKKHPWTFDAQQGHKRVELYPMDAFFFILFSTPILILAHYFNIYLYFAVCAAMSGATVITRFITRPILHNYWLAMGCSSLLTSYWLFLAFTVEDQGEHPYYWILQDVMCACLAMQFFDGLVTNSLKTVAVFLVTTFCYDYVFIYVLERMQTESTEFQQCQKSGQLDCYSIKMWEIPALIVMPYSNSSAKMPQPTYFAALGMGDILIPGILLSFAARLDWAKRLATAVDLEVPGHVPTTLWQGYLPPLLVAYTIGLTLAMLVVIWTGNTQPALVFINPICLLTIVLLSYRYNELGILWNGPLVFDWAENLVKYVDKISDGAVPNPKTELETGKPQE